MVPSRSNPSQTIRSQWRYWPIGHCPNQRNPRISLERMCDQENHAVGKEIMMRSCPVRNASVVSCQVIDHLGNGRYTTKERRRSSSTAAACIKTEWSEDRDERRGKWSGGLKLSTTSQSQSCVRSCSWQIVLHSRAVMCIVYDRFFDRMSWFHCIVEHWWRGDHGRKRRGVSGSNWLAWASPHQGSRNMALNF